MKNFLYSKTIWFNAVTILVVIVTMFGYTPDQQLANQTSTLLVTLSPIINLVLRYFTTKSIAILPEK